jgi:HEPN domain-containing protein
MTEPSAMNLKLIAEERLIDAKLLLASSRWSAAYYLSGYAVECGLKAIIAAAFREGVIPDKKLVNRVHTHDLAELINLAGLHAAKAVRSAEPGSFSSHWDIVSNWNETVRYDLVLAHNARRMVEAVSDPDDGVFQWLKTHW